MKNKIRNTFLSLRIRNYRLYFIGQAISLSGTWIQTIAQGWLVLQLTHSGTQLGIVYTFQFLPILILGPWGGLVADRFSKRKILYLTQGIFGVLALVLGILVLTHSIQIYMVYIFALILGLVNVINSPTLHTFIPEMVGKENLQNAVSLNVMESNLARAIGPALAGILILSVGIGWCFIFNAISFIAVIIAFSIMKEKELHLTFRAQNKSGQLMEGLRYVRSNPILFNTLLMMAIIGTLSYEFATSLPLIAQYTFHGDAGSYAFLQTFIGIGSAVGGLLAASRKKISSNMIVVSAMGLGVSLTIAAFMPNIFLMILVMFIVGIFSINYISLSNTTLQTESRPEMRGRVMALWTVAFLGSTSIGGPIIGWIGEHIGPRYGLAVGGVAAIIAAFIGKIKIARNNETHIVSSETKILEEEVGEQMNLK
ncbi:MAG: MFS transporter [Candidatus Pacebacteria bacterium]|nr:MFS transporter [Candidatus Paceibacterota bacterium]